MTDTTEAGSAGSDQTPIVTRTAGGEGPLSAYEAARSLLDTRRKDEAAATQQPSKEIQQPSAPVEATAAQESGDEPGAAPQEPEAPGETEGEAEPEAQLPPIEPPRSWTKEEKERFATLPRETQEYLAERETQRDRDHRRSQNEAAEQRKGIEAERGKVEQARQQYEQALPIVLSHLQAAYQGDFADIKTMDDVQRLAAQDPMRYSQWDAQQKRIAAVQQEIVASQQRSAAEAQEQLRNFINREAEKFAERAPEIKDEATKAKLTTAAVSVLHDLGFTDDELGKLYRGEVGLSLHDHRMQLLILDGVKYRDAKSRPVTQQPKKPVPPVQRPGVPPDKGATREAHLKNLTTQLDQKSGMDALRAATNLLMERRRAG